MFRLWRIKWNEVQDDGKRKVKWDGSGKENALKKKKESGRIGDYNGIKKYIYKKEKEDLV